MIAEAEPPVEWHTLSADEAARRLATDPTGGLSEAEAGRRLRLSGPNRLSATGADGPLRLLASQFRSVLVLVLIVAVGVSFLLREWLDASTILAILVLNAVLGFVQEYRAGQALDALRRMAAPQATVVREGRSLRLPAEVLVPGDLIEIAAGEAIPADARIVSTAGLRLSEAALTGESFPVTKSSQPADPEAPLADRTSMLFSGTLVLGGRGRALVTATGDASEFGRIAELVRTAERERTPLEAGLDQMGRWLAGGALVAATLVFISGLLTEDDLADAFLTAVALAVAAIPEGLPAAVTIVLALGVRRMAGRHAIVRRLAAVETLGSTTIICSDKTGTLTQNALAARRLWCDGRVVEADERAVRDADPELPPDLTLALRMAALSLSTDEAQPGSPLDPTDVALARLVEAGGRSLRQARDGCRAVAEYPFDADRKRTGMAYATAGKVRIVVVKGAPESVIERCSAVRIGGRRLPLDGGWRDRFEETLSEFASDGLRPIALAYREVEPDADLDLGDAGAAERDLTLVALVGMIDTLRPEVASALRTAAGAGIRTVMITGDHPATARAIAREAGLGAEPRTVTGRQLAGMENGEFERLAPDIDVYARVTSEDKLRIVRAMKKHGEVVAMTGDGVNDAPALREADIGIAMGRAGTEVARQAADLVLTDDNYASIVAAVEEGRTIFNNIRRFVMFLVAANLGELVVVLLGGLSGSAPLLPVQILWVNLVTDGLPALALGLEPAEPGVMDQRPRPARGRILTRGTTRRILLSTALIATATLLAFWIGHERGGIDEARNLALGTLVMTQMFAVFTFRSAAVPLHRLGLRTNRALLYAVAAALAAQLVVFFVPFARAPLSTEALGPVELCAVISLALPSLLVPEVVKELRLTKRPRY